ncbi:MAG: ATP-binding protein [Rhodospirillales bacterium]|nr:ATP-binding protein [Rhodospirillales bacterium]
MITSLQLKDFKNFADETLRVGPFTVIVGTNASGKSNIRDAFRVLHGIGRRYTLAEIIGGKYGAGGQVEWGSIRGAPHEIANREQESFGLRVELALEERTAEFAVNIRPKAFGADGFRIGYEKFSVNGQSKYSANYGSNKSISYYGNFRSCIDDRHQYLSEWDQPLLTQFVEIPSATGKQIEPVVDMLASMRFLDLVPDRMRQPSLPGQIILGDGGENLPAVLKALCMDPGKEEVLTQWTRELTPMDVADFDFREGPDGKVHLILQEMSGREISAQSASDGTLRFLAMLAALLGPDPARLYFFEEIDNGIHPSRLNLLIDLIEQQTAKGEVQVVATTHSPQLLSMIGDSTFENTSVVCRLEDAEDAVIRRIAGLPNVKELRKSQGLGRLLAGGWMETALAFTEEDKKNAKDSE